MQKYTKSPTPYQYQSPEIQTKYQYSYSVYFFITEVHQIKKG